ncbi:PadR family transcriptional regulator [candidate division KSB1 bacterium]
MNLMSRSEEIMLLTILKLKENAYGVSIREQIKNDSGKEWSFASIYQPLDKLTRKGFVRKLKGEPTPERGGKRKYYYEITEQGKSALLDIKKASENFWSGIPEIAGK